MPMSLYSPLRRKERKKDSRACVLEHFSCSFAPSCGNNLKTIMNRVRLGIIGMGNMGKYHADYLLANKVARCELTAFSEPSGANRERYKQLKYFESSEKLIRS